VKKTAIVVAAVAMFVSVSAGAEDLKLKVPVEKWRQLRTRLYSLEKENLVLKRKLRSVGGGEAAAAAEKEAARLDELAAENARLRKQLADMQTAAGAGSELRARLDLLEEENRRLRSEVDGLKAAVATAEGGGNADRRIAVLERRNLRLKKKIQALRSGVVAISYTGEMRSARGEFFRARRRAAKVLAE